MTYHEKCSLFYHSDTSPISLRDVSRPTIPDNKITPTMLKQDKILDATCHGESSCRPSHYTHKEAEEELMEKHLFADGVGRGERKIDLKINFQTTQLCAHILCTFLGVVSESAKHVASKYLCSERQGRESGTVTDEKEEKYIGIFSKIEGNKLYVTFENNGPEIPEEVKENMFKKFFTTKEKKSGSGLGLSIVQNILTDHNASIDVYSDDKITRFTVTFDLK